MPTAHACCPLRTTDVSAERAYVVSAALQPGPHAVAAAFVMASLASVGCARVAAAGLGDPTVGNVDMPAANGPGSTLVMSTATATARMPRRLLTCGTVATIPEAGHRRIRWRAGLVPYAPYTPEH
jgi:hypothetical protein